MRYRQYAPPADLTAWVECCWTLQGSPIGEPSLQTIAPDGRMELIFHFGEPPLRNGSRQSGSLLTGQLTQALSLQPCGPMDTVGIRLRPEAGRAITGAPSQQFAGEILSMEDVLGRWAAEARERAGQFPETARRLACLWAALRQILRTPPDPLAAESIRRIEELRGRGRIEAWYAGLDVRPRQWERRFLQSTGLTAKEFARIIRFQNLIALHEAGQWRRWADLAMECGFYDQSHMANEFRTFSGSSPEAFFRESAELAKLFLRRDLPAR